MFQNYDWYKMASLWYFDNWTIETSFRFDFV